LLIGNEYPWFDRPRLPAADEQTFRLLLSHSPDQIWWARRHQVQLMLAGHTHGGQGRLPLIGPILGPSFHGSRFAAGDFFKSPTTMHVSRGLSGTHLIRIHCRPELSLITLRLPQ
jgi:predicted MPP superfamily phosphohydrolase